MRRLLLIFLSMLSVVQAAPQGAAKARVADVTSLAVWQAEATRSHPTVAAALARVEAARAAVGGVRLWEDPMLGLGLTGARTSMRADDGDIRLMAGQPLPRRGLYQAQRGKALAVEQAAAAEVGMAGNMLELEVAKTALELALSDEVLVIEAEQLTWVERMSVNATEKLKDLTANAAGPLRLKSELTQERQKLAAAQRERLRLAQQLNLLLGRPVTQEWPTLALPLISDAAPEINSEWKSLVARHPRLAALLYVADAAGAESAIVREERKPVVALSLESNVYSGGDLRDVMLGVRVTLPWWNKSIYDANEARARLEQEAALKDLASAQRELGAQAVMATTEARNAGRQAVAYSNEVLPDAEKAAQAVENSWISATSTLAEVLEARRSLLMARMEQRRFVAAQQSALATLRALRGGR